MDVPEKLLQFKFHFIFLTLFSILVALIVTYSSSNVTIFSYFWHLVVSTGLFFSAVVVFGRISPPEADCPGEKTEQSSSTMSQVVHDLDAGDLADAQRGEGEDLAPSGGDAEDFGGGGKEVRAEVEEGAVEEGRKRETENSPFAELFSSRRALKWFLTLAGFERLNSMGGLS